MPLDYFPLNTNDALWQQVYAFYQKLLAQQEREVRHGSTHE